MASGFEVVQADIRAAARKLGETAEGVENADPSKEVTPIGTAMPGSRSAAAAARLTSTWQTRFSTWGSDATTQQDKLVDSAADYDAADYASSQRHIAQRRGL